MIGDWIIYAASKTPVGDVISRAVYEEQTGRTVRWHTRHEILSAMYAAGRSRKAKRNLRIRQHLMERPFARGVCFGMKKARWRRLWRVQIQEYLVSTVQTVTSTATMERHGGIRTGEERLGTIRLSPDHTRVSYRLVLVVGRESFRTRFRDAMDDPGVRMLGNRPLFCGTLYDETACDPRIGFFLAYGPTGGDEDFFRILPDSVTATGACSRSHWLSLRRPYVGYGTVGRIQFEMLFDRFDPVGRPILPHWAEL